MTPSDELKRAVEVIVKHITRPASVGEDDRWMSLGRAATYADVSVDTLRRAIAEGGLKAHGEGKLQRVRRSEVDAWLEGLTPAKASSAIKADAILKRVKGS